MDKSSRGRLQPPGLDPDNEIYESSHSTQTSPTIQQRPGRTSSLHHSHPKPPPTPSTGIPPAMHQNVPNPLLPSAPASPPTPAPSPTPLQRSAVWNREAYEVEDSALTEFRLVFSRLDTRAKEAWLESIVETCDNHLLSHLHQLVSPKLKKDPFETLPNELCFKVQCQIKSTWLLANFSRSLPSSMILEPSFAPHKCQDAGAKFSAMIKHGSCFARSMPIGECQAHPHPLARMHHIIFTFLHNRLMQRTAPNLQHMDPTAKILLS